MPLNDKVSIERKKKGMTQEELASLTNITVRTIQRIEKGESIPRLFTIKAIAAALEIPFEELTMEDETTILPQELPKTEESDIGSTKHFLQIFYLSCFSYLVIPYVHFLVPIYLSKKVRGSISPIADIARKFIRTQIAWVIAFHALLLATLVYNILQAKIGNSEYLINYLWVMFLMYLLNAVLILNKLFNVRRLPAVEGALLSQIT